MAGSLLNLQELMSMIAAVLWAFLWWPVGRQFGWWPSLGITAAGGLAGVLIGWLMMEWIDQPWRGGTVLRTAQSVAWLIVWAVFVALPFTVKTFILPM